MLFQSRIRRGVDGAVHVDLDENERALLREVAEELRSQLDQAPEDPSLNRLFPPAHTDPEREREYQELTRGQLLTGRARTLAVLLETADHETLTRDEADSWLRALNDARLVLGTRLDITEDFDWDGFDATAPQAYGLALYAYLSWLQEQLVEAM